MIHVKNLIIIDIFSFEFLEVALKHSSAKLVAPDLNF